jgi:hypothetical protein
MKLASLEILFCKEVYELLSWFKKNRNMQIPSKEDYNKLIEINEIQTMGIWFENVGLVSVLKISKDAANALWGLRQISIPLSSDDLIRINSGLKNTSDDSIPKITLWLRPDTTGSKLAEIESHLAQIGFIKDFANNWDFAPISP